MSSVLATWNPDRLRKQIPFVGAYVGQRKSGKSVAMTYITNLLQSEFDLIISFCGSISCSPQLFDLFTDTPGMDPRFMLDRMTVGFLDKLREQQEELKMEGRIREVLLLFDDLELSSEEHTALGFFTTRGRHYNVSTLYCSVSYTSIPKNYRRSLDFLWLFSVPMSTDKKILLGEYSRNPSFANYCINQLQKYECLVLDCSTHRQELFTFCVPFQNSTNHLAGPIQTSPQPVETDTSVQNEGSVAPENIVQVSSQTPAS